MPNYLELKKKCHKIVNNIKILKLTKRKYFNINS